MMPHPPFRINPAAFSIPPKADIESIRQLLSGYGSSSILKELIQNAEDAEASRMDVFYVPGDPISQLSLLKGPALLVANNGVFTEENLWICIDATVPSTGHEELPAHLRVLLSPMRLAKYRYENSLVPRRGQRSLPFYRYDRLLRLSREPCK
jgi:hypothetical protein